MIYLNNRRNSCSDYYSPQEISDHYKTILDPNNIIDSKQIPVTRILQDSKSKEYNFRISILQIILYMLDQIDYECVEKMHGNTILAGCTITQNQYSRIILSQLNKSYLNTLYDIQRKQFELFCSITLTQPSLNWVAYYINSHFFDYSKIVSDLLKSPLGIKRIHNLANAYVDLKVDDLMYYHTKPTKGFNYSFGDMITKKRWRLKEAKKSYLENNPYFKKW